MWLALLLAVDSILGTKSLAIFSVLIVSYFNIEGVRRGGFQALLKPRCIRANVMVVFALFVILRAVFLPMYWIAFAWVILCLVEFGLI